MVVAGGESPGTTTEPSRTRLAPVVRSPAALGLGGAGLGVGLVSGLAALPALAVALGADATGTAVALMRRRWRRPPVERIDPFTLGETWRGPVKGAMQAAARYHQVVQSTPPGPVRERLIDIGASIDRGIEECWRVARRGDALAGELSALDGPGTQRRLVEAGEASDDTLVPSLRSRLASAERLEVMVDQARRHLVALEARLHEAVATAVEVSQLLGEAGGGGHLAPEVDEVVDQLVALRSALDETDDVGQ